MDCPIQPQAIIPAYQGSDCHLKVQQFQKLKFCVKTHHSRLTDYHKEAFHGGSRLLEQNPCTLTTTAFGPQLRIVSPHGGDHSRVVPDHTLSRNRAGPDHNRGTHVHNPAGGLRTDRVRHDDHHDHCHAHSGNHKGVGHRSVRLTGRGSKMNVSYQGIEKAHGRCVLEARSTFLV